MKIETNRAESLCSLTSIRWGFSPGACVRDITVKAEVWTMDLTAAAQSHGNPKNPQMMLVTQIMTMSKCRPVPFFSLRSGLLMISLQGRRWNKKFYVHTKLKRFFDVKFWALMFLHLLWNVGFHEQQNVDQHCRDHRGEHEPHWERFRGAARWYKPASVFGIGWGQSFRYV